MFRELDAFDLLMVEQPLHHDDLRASTPSCSGRSRTDLCLDESIRSAAARRPRSTLGVVPHREHQAGPGGRRASRPAACTTSRARHGVPVWCGGMLETGIGRAQNLALAAMPGFTLPGDTSASARYFLDDLTEPFEMAPDGTMAVPAGPGHRGHAAASTAWRGDGAP